jgi:hypothetical protein
MRHNILMATTAITLAATLGLSTPASADIVFQLGNHPQQPSEENILFTNGESGLTLTDGQVDHTGASVLFTTLGSPLQVLAQASGGQAKIECLANCVDNNPIHNPDDNQLSSISMRAGTLNGAATAWTDAIIDLTNGVGTALVTVTDNFGNPFTYSLGNGSNFLTMVAVPGSGEVITRIDVTNANPGQAFGFTQFDQPRVSGLCTLVGATCTTVPVPEPTGLLILTTSALGLLWAKKKGRKVCKREMTTVTVG